MNNIKIDFVIPWVDGSDPKWIDERRKYKSDSSDDSVRFRDWGVLRYWFRGVERYAPWVHKIHFVTCGQIPEWMNVDHPKLNIVNHQDYIPAEYLPTFSSHTIELNFNRIQGLSEYFVYFNDDIFLNNVTQKEDFFVNHLPCDMAVLYPNRVTGINGQFDHILLNDAEFFARHFDIKKCFRQNRNKWITPIYGKSLLKTFFLMPFPEFPGIMLHHQPQSYLKTTLNQVWKEEKLLIEETCKNKFRTKDDINQYIFRYWQIGKGEFEPADLLKRGHYVSIEPGTDYCRLLNSKYKILCINDADENIDFIEESAKLQAAFRMKFPEKSMYEV